MSNSQLKALLKKNLILMKRSAFITACEILFPMILMCLLALVINLFTIKDTFITVSDEEYIKNNTFFYMTVPPKDFKYRNLTVNPGL
jgi:hypothetical protein